MAMASALRGHVQQSQDFESRVVVCIAFDKYIPCEVVIYIKV